MVSRMFPPQGYGIDTEDFSYIIYIDDDGYAKAKNCKTGRIDFSANATNPYTTYVGTLFNNVFNALPDGGAVLLKRGVYYTWAVNTLIKDNIHLYLESGTKWYFFNILLGSNTGIIGLGRAELYADGRPGDYIYVDAGAGYCRITNTDRTNGNSNIQLRNIYINGRGDVGIAYNRLISFIIVNNLYMENVYLYNANNSLFELRNGDNARILNCVFDTVQHGGICTVGIHSCNDVVIEGCVIKNSPDLSLNISNNSTNIRVERNLITNGSSDGIFAEMTYNNANMENIIIRDNILKTLAHGITVTYNADAYIRDVKIIGNIIDSCVYYGIRVFRYSSSVPANRIEKVRILYNTIKNCTYPLAIHDTLDYVIKFNSGYVTENSGTAVIPANQTSVTVNHGLATTPGKVIVTPRGNIGAVWVSARDATSFTINCSTAPSADTIIDWYAEV